MTETPEPSDQLPEEAPEEVARRSGAQAAREEADVREGEGQATGNPKSAG
jgi:hypothetical protein